MEFYDPSSSSTASLISCSDVRCSLASQSHSHCSRSNKQCSYTLQYGDGSRTSGSYVSDLINLNTLGVTSNFSAHVVFGCSTSESGLLTDSYRAIGGIFGFGQHGLSIILQLSSQGIAPNAFAHCLVGSDTGGGILVIGQIMEPNVVYTPLVPSHISKIFPTVNFNFDGGAIMILRPQDYLLQQYSMGGAEMWCIGFQISQNQGMTILGDLVLKDKLIVYDLGCQRIGWTDYDCSSSINVSSTSSCGGSEGINGGRTGSSSSLQGTRYKLLLMLIIVVFMLSVQ